MVNSQVLIAKFINLIILISLIIPYSKTQSDDIEWNNYVPTECFGDLNYRLPKKVIDLNISVVVSAIYEISEERMEFGMQLDLYEFWRDPFLMIPITDENSNRSAVLLPRQIVDCIWKPDTMFQNAKEERLYEQTSPNLFYKIVFEKSDFSFISRKSRYKLTVACPMNFGYYPMDRQKCSLEIGLFNSRKHEVRLQWDDGLFANIKLKENETPLNFAVKRLRSTKTEFQYPGVSVVMEFLQDNFLFERSLSASLFNTYIPSFLVVCLSMVSFWLDINAVPGRVTLGVTAILTLSTQIVQARSDLPVLDYMTAMDVWLLGCLIMVFLSLVEFTLANTYVRKMDAVEKEKATTYTTKEASLAWVENLSESAICAKCQSKIEPTNTTTVKKLKPTKENKPKGIKVKDNYFDRTSRVLFPTSMVIFSFGYWFYYYYNSYIKMV